ncbi:MAG: hypothetical protein I4O49_03005 [Janthinobacterium lividum]|nr:hypothetical protein [Janthinobacterium lividum]
MAIPATSFVQQVPSFPCTTISCTDASRWRMKRTMESTVTTSIWRVMLSRGRLFILDLR